MLLLPFVHAALVATSCVASAPASPAPHNSAAATAAISGAAIPDSTYRRLFESGVTMDAFLAAARQRKEQWAANYARGAVPDAVLTAARSAPGPWKLLVVAVDGCSDSVNTVPYIARLAEQVMGVELRIIDSAAGRVVMDAHRTPDGRGATPTVVLLDATFRERGCFIERPAELRDWILGNKGKQADKDIMDHKMTWYDTDAGQRTVAEVAELIAAAGRGEVKC
ncbi:MAG: thioredoxin family protein [Gemmatimonadaceae bacterium]|nr:thioredoxin family protein [Gemmatimonadaceae bacterium]